ncbi:MAG: glycosyl transferase [Oligoflexia bacterium]|nr:MAG: glycosyl transferase [Oligoflexia bacterium]
MVKVFKNQVWMDRERGLRGQNPDSAMTLVIAFYKNFPVLDLTLASVEIQTMEDFSLIICDDGSDEPTVNILHQRLNQMKIPILHLWHEDKGFRKNRILNWGIHHCPSEWMVFIDQDCILHHEFLREHYEYRQPNAVLCGRRMDLTPVVTKLLTREKVYNHYLQKNLWWILPFGLYMKDNNGGKGIYFKSSWLRRLANQKPRAIVGCNFSLAKKHLIDINGFDFRYEGAGIGEDSDIEYRLRLNGVQMVPFCNTAVQYHQYHRLLNRPNENEKIFEQVQKEKKAVTEYGLRQQLA